MASFPHLRPGFYFHLRALNAYYDIMGIKHWPADTHMHTAVGICERFNHTLRLFARAIYFDEQVQWDLYLPLIVLFYNATVNDETGYSPFFLDHGRKPVLPWEVAIEGTQDLDTRQPYIRRLTDALHTAWDSVQKVRLQQEDDRRQAQPVSHTSQ